MDQELKVKWVEALRSGRYQQAHGELRDDDGAMCCLGVLREIIDPGARYSAENTIILTSKHDAGLLDMHRSLLAHMNDGTGGNHRHSFAEIADYIEKNL